MAYTSKSGERFTNLSQAKAADRKYGQVPVPGRAVGDGRQPLAQSKFPKPEPERKASLVSDKPSTEDSDPSEQTPGQAVAEHGPATSVTVSHGDKHTVESNHADGHTHRSTHDDAEEAHRVASRLAGVDSDSEQDGDNQRNLSEIM
jgi:hypothetical protein